MAIGYDDELSNSTRFLGCHRAWIPMSIKCNGKESRYYYRDLLAKALEGGSGGIYGSEKEIVDIAKTALQDPICFPIQWHLQ